MPQIQLSFNDVDDFLSFIEQMREVGRRFGIEIEVKQRELVKPKDKGR
jgi:hypothetical protein